MKCKGCGKEIAGDEHRKVADWFFCLECFGKLMEKPQAKPAPDAAVDNVPLKKKTVTCRVCNKEMGAQPAKKIGIWDLCDKCHAQLIFKSPEPTPSKEHGDHDREEPENETHDSDAVSSGRINVAVSKTVNCHACDREILAMASKEIDGNPFCPDCFYQLREHTVSHEAKDNSEIKKKEVICDGCGKEITENDTRAVDGFLICEACIATDKKLAVQIAKNRHYKRLEKLRKAFD